MSAHPWANGSRVRKLEFRAGDSHGIGALGTIRSRVGPIDYQGRKEVYGYFVEWDDMRGYPVLVTGYRIELLESEQPSGNQPAGQDREAGKI